MAKIHSGAAGSDEDVLRCCCCKTLAWISIAIAARVPTAVANPKAARIERTMRSVFKIDARVKLTMCMLSVDRMRSPHH